MPADLLRTVTMRVAGRERTFALVGVDSTDCTNCALYDVCTVCRWIMQKHRASCSGANYIELPSEPRGE